jgi:signal transduction histidine kinase
MKIIQEKEVKLKGIANFKSFAMDTSGTAWFGNKDGLWYIIDSIPKQYLFDSTIIQTYCSHITADKKNRLWICTMGRGIYCIDPVQKRILLHLNTSKGLNSDVCTKLLIDQQENIWISTSKGLCKISNAFNDNKRQIINLSQDNILPGNVVFDIGLFQNKILICTSKGLVECPVEVQISENINQTPTYITHIEARHATKVTDQMVYTQSGNPVEINFVQIAYGKGEVARYQYRLNDSRLKPWEYTTNTFVKYEQLLPGEYEFQVRASTERPGVNPRIATVSIIVTPIYWQTWWFRLFIIVTFVAIFTSITVVYFNAKNKETLSNKKLIESQLNSLRAQINPHFIFNSLNSIQDFILDQQPRMANIYLTKFASLMRMIVEHSKKEFTSLTEETEFLELYLSLEKLRLNNNLDIKIDIDTEIEPMNTPIPTMLLQPLIENAIKHGLAPSQKNRVLEIHFNLVDQKLLRCTIQDNGVGRNPQQKTHAYQFQKSSVGIINITERMELLFGNRQKFTIFDMRDEEGKTSGTKVEIIIPVV